MATNLVAKNISKETVYPRATRITMVCPYSSSCLSMCEWTGCPRASAREPTTDATGALHTSELEELGVWLTSVGRVSSVM